MTQRYLAPNTPVADWRCVPQGYGYGNFYDPVTKAWATVTRTTPKTARYSKADGTLGIRDVGAGYLALEPWSLHQTGGIGFAAMIEEARTNYLLNSSFEVDSNSDGLADNWGIAADKTVAGVRTVSRVLGAHGSYAQRVQYVGASGDSDIRHYLLSDPTAVGSFAADQTACFRCMWKGSASGVSAVQVRLYALDAAGVPLGTVAVSGTLSESWAYSPTVVYSALPANTSKMYTRVDVAGVDAVDTFDITIDACQLEKAAFPTSYIPTTTAAVTRNADVVTVPTTRWNAAAGTMAAVAGISDAVNGRLVSWKDATDANSMRLYRPSAASAAFYSKHGGTGVGPTSKSEAGAMACVAAATFADGGNQIVYSNGVGASTAGFVAPAGLPATAAIGALDATAGWFNGAIHRIPIYAAVLSGATLATPGMTTDLLDGLDTARITNEVWL
jgi:hypothetical protein